MTQDKGRVVVVYGFDPETDRSFRFETELRPTGFGANDAGHCWAWFPAGEQGTGIRVFLDVSKYPADLLQACATESACRVKLKSTALTAREKALVQSERIRARARAMELMGFEGAPVDSEYGDGAVSAELRRLNEMLRDLESPEQA